MRMRQTRRALSVALAASSTVAWAGVVATPPHAGVHSYRYEVQEVSPVSTKGYRTDIRLTSDGHGGAVADLIDSQTYDGKTWTRVTVDPACAAALHARPGELARVTLLPLSPEQAKLGDAFLAPCAPAGVFFPLTDILNVVLIQSSDAFHLRDLNEVGQSATFPGFATSIDRPEISMTETSSGGSISLAGVEAGRAQVDWKPDVAKLDLVEKNAGGPAKPFTLSGTEHFAFRVQIDVKTGTLERADTLYDDLDMTVQVPGAEGPAPRVAIKRIVSLGPMPVM